MIKQRVNEMKQDHDWKEKIAQEWNQANAENYNTTQGPKETDNKSVMSYCKILFLFFQKLVALMLQSTRLTQLLERRGAR